MDLSLYLVTDRSLCQGRSLIEVVRQAVAGGVSAVQIREKEVKTREFIRLAREVHDILSQQNIPLFINDRLDVALAVQAEGLHLGQDDMHVLDVKKIVGHKFTLGLTVNTVHNVLEGDKLPVDYLSAGPVFPTRTKKDTKPLLGIEGLKELRKKSTRPLIAIGSINEKNVDKVMRTGVQGVAVAGAICSADSPYEAARNLRQIIEENR